MRPTVPNPSERGALRDVALISDRAKRYRAQDAIEQSDKRCYLCGAPEGAERRMDVEHIDGFEAHANPANLAYACRPCNTRKGRMMGAAGKGKKTVQRNPAKSAGAQSPGQYALAAMVLRGESNAMSLDDAIALMHATPPDTRSRFAASLYRRSRAVREQNKRSRQSEIPF